VSERVALIPVPIVQYRPPDPDDVADMFIFKDSLDLPEFAEIEGGIASGPRARRAVGLRADEPVPPGYAVGFMRRWLSEYRDAGGNFTPLRMKWSRRLSNS
jgi:hypothetical protein